MFVLALDMFTIFCIFIQYNIIYMLLSVEERSFDGLDRRKLLQLSCLESCLKKIEYVN